MADAVSDAYLAEARSGLEGGRLALQLNGRDILPGSSWAPMVHPRLGSTRTLERFRNQVALQRVLQRQYHSVVAIYEDRYDLWGFEPETGALLRRKLPVRRAPDMAALTGWRATLSMLLEALDVVLPMLRNIGDRISSVLSFFFVNLIGRSLGLIFRGVRQGLGLSSSENAEGSATSQAPPGTGQRQQQGCRVSNGPFSPLQLD